MSTTLSLGQSNNLGGVAAVGGAFAFSAGLTVWNNTSEVADSTTLLGNDWIVPVLGAPPFRSSGANNFGAHACSLMADISGDPQQLIISGAAGSILQRWMNLANEPQTQMDRLMAILAEAEVTAADRVFWLQGESDVNEGWIDEYPVNNERVWAYLEAQGVIDANTPIIIGLLSAHHGWQTDGGLNDTLREMVKTSSRNMALAETASLPTLPLDDSHFSGQGLVRAGRRYVEALSGLDATFMGVWS